MIRPLINAEPARPFSTRPSLPKVHVVVGGRDQCSTDKSERSPACGGFPSRPDASLLSETIPLFFIGRNRRGFWLAREARGRIGGLFWLRRSALRFAAKNGGAVGCATMLLAHDCELDTENHGSPFAAAFDFIVRKLGPKSSDAPAAVGAPLVNVQDFSEGGRG